MKDTTMQFIQARAELLEVPNKIKKMLKQCFNAFDYKAIIDVNFNNEYYRMDIIINGKEYYIGVNGKGINLKKYYSEVLEILMSWGERSCKYSWNDENPCPSPNCDWATCNVNCDFYEWDGVTTPDSTKTSVKPGKPEDTMYVSERQYEQLKEVGLTDSGKLEGPGYNPNKKRGPRFTPKKKKRKK
jgi:hypothetical protein